VEAFGPASKPRSKSTLADGQSYTVHFTNSGQEGVWDGTHTSLLELAEINGVDLEHDCEIGNCGSCEVPIVEGTVDSDEGGAVPAPSCCLACVSVPTSDLVLEA